MSSLPVLVHGARGAQGAAVVRAALAAGMRVRVLLRGEAPNPFGDAVEVARGDLADVASLRRASSGVSAVYLVIPVSAGPAEVELWGRNAIDAATGAGVERVVFNTSSVGSSRSTGVASIDAKLALEQRLQVTPIPSVVLRTTLYMGNLAGPWIAPMHSCSSLPNTTVRSPVF